VFSGWFSKHCSLPVDWFPVEAKNCSVHLFNSCVVNVLLAFRGAIKLYGVLSMKLRKNETVSYILHPLFLDACEKKLKKWSSHLIFYFHILINCVVFAVQNERQY
jgi:hypothetical protein